MATVKFNLLTCVAPKPILLKAGRIIRSGSHKESPQLSNTASYAARSLNGGRDEFFTKPDVADRLTRGLADLLQGFAGNIIEPAAGDGVFVDSATLHFPLADTRGFDIEPQAHNIVKQNFLTSTRERAEVPTLVLGNPPFGFASSLAIKFFNHAAKFADYIAFVIPKSFMKVSIQNRLSDDFHLIEQIELSKDDSTFRLESGLKFVPCVWQVWERRVTKRAKIITDVANNTHIQFLPDAKGATHALRRVGGRSGQVLAGLEYSTSTTYFVRALRPGVITRLRKADFSVLASRTAGVRSISKAEIVLFLQGDQPA